jgi:hypothetical protein
MDGCFGFGRKRECGACTERDCERDSHKSKEELRSDALGAYL